MEPLRAVGFFHKDEFETAVHRYGTWPTTVWPLRDNEFGNRKLKRLLGDTGATRSHPGARHGYKTTVGKNSVGAVTSIFPPRLAANILRMYCPPGQAKRVFDPFAGGGCRAVMAAKAGHEYFGIEIRKEEVKNIGAICKKWDVADQVTIIHGDACDENGLAERSMDFCYTCPPYWDLERYEGGPADLSMIEEYDGYLAGMSEVVAQTARLLKPGAISCWVVGLLRHNGKLILLHHDIARLHAQHGFEVHEEVVVHRDNPIALLRSGNFERGGKYLIRQHEYCLVFKAPA